MLFFEELGLTHRRAAEIAVDVYSILSKDIDIAQGLKEIKKKYRDSELILATWSYAFSIAIIECVENGSEWAFFAYNNNLMWVKLATENKEHAIKMLEKALEELDKHLKDKENEDRKIYW